jgi:hypothetical protein
VRTNKPPINLPGEIVVLLVIPEGMQAYCTICNRSVTPYTWTHGVLRATLQAAWTDRLVHCDETHGGRRVTEE